MTNDELLAAATRAATKAAKVAADATAEAVNVRRRQRTLARAVIALGVALLVLLVLVSAILVYLVPTAARNAEILREIQDVTSPAAQAEGDAKLGGLICGLVADHHGLHDSPPPDSLAIVVPVFKDGKPTGETETVRFPCLTPEVAP